MISERYHDQRNVVDWQRWKPISQMTQKVLSIEVAVETLYRICFGWVNWTQHEDWWWKNFGIYWQKPENDLVKMIPVCCEINAGLKQEHSIRQLVIGFRLLSKSSKLGQRDICMVLSTTMLKLNELMRRDNEIILLNCEESVCIEN
jgi:hypothetical protein